MRASMRPFVRPLVRPLGAWLVLGSLALAGCGTIAAVGSRESGPLPFDGVKYDLDRAFGAHTRWALPWFLYLIDLGASLAFDTVLLPLAVVNGVGPTPLEFYEVTVAPLETVTT